MATQDAVARGMTFMIDTVDTTMEGMRAHTAVPWT
eukprot:CAMPEP_0204631738 /NCGR_PEP_ID=MMETSP0717-20131115/23390_1 /ASSEMBLY_ACC=CAM_ASM_000666 /TAXON_ID=230516 /ORGANISM="Chaetoceros curvisetus" /LENGTH=34 /DNA_ID= /DNA_START= /DNA_END= /DNA_ORIENTATION=